MRNRRSSGIKPVMAECMAVVVVVVALDVVRAKVALFL
jgi:hypothetical protein